MQKLTDSIVIGCCPELVCRQALQAVNAVPRLVCIASLAILPWVSHVGWKVDIQSGCADAGERVSKAIVTTSIREEAISDWI